MQYFALVSFVCIVQVKLHVSFCSERLTFNIITLKAEFSFTAGFRRSGMGANVAEFRG